MRSHRTNVIDDGYDGINEEAVVDACRVYVVLAHGREG
jgi:hypothetical protein